MTPAAMQLRIPGKRRRVLAPPRQPARRPASALPGAGAGSGFWRRSAALSLLLHATLAWGLARHLAWPEAARDPAEAITVTLLDQLPAPAPIPLEPEPLPPPPPEPERPPPPEPEPVVFEPPPAPIPVVQEVVATPLPLPVLSEPPPAMPAAELIEEPASVAPAPAPAAVPPVDEYWMAVRAAVAGLLRTPAGLAVHTSIVVRVRGTAAGFEVLAPERGDGLHAAAVRAALERVARRTRLAPSAESAPEAEWVVRFVEETRRPE